MAEQVQTAEGTEFLVSSWGCPSCGHEQQDTVHPVRGPWISCTCGNCGRAFSDEQLDEQSRDSWEDARATAEAYNKIHPQD